MTLSTAAPRGQGDPGQLRVPAATYRLQFNHEFTFQDALALVPYLDELGVSDLYASPLLRARQDSAHGYDICDPTQFNPAIGSYEEFAALADALHARGMGLLFDAVPNHMGINDACNTWWLDVLENGRSSPFASFFDIDWHPTKPELQDKILLPILEDQYGTVLESGKLRLAYDDGCLRVNHYRLMLPAALESYAQVLESCLDRLHTAEGSLVAAGGLEATDPLAGPAPAFASGEDGPALVELQSILTALKNLPSRLETAEQDRLAERVREKEVIKRRLAALCNSEPSMREALEATLAEFNGQPGNPDSFDLLDRFLEAQVYRLAFWHVAGEEINYRRFFDINDLVAVRVQVPEVFQATHQFILRLLREGKVTGLRIDHPDGLWDPPAYFQRLQESFARAMMDRDQAARAASEQAPSPSAEGKAQGKGDGAALETGNARARSSDGELPLYVVAEKILSEREPLPESWAVYGTTGYDFLGSVNNLFVHAGNGPAFESLYTEFIGRSTDLDDLIIQSKMLIMRDALASEINALSSELERIAERNRHYRDFTFNGITAALREVIACLPVYRTYINAVTGEVPDQDRKFVQMAMRTARRRRPGLADALFDFIHDTLLLRNLADFREEDRPRLINFVMQFQQLTGTAMAKGVEDTVFYLYNRLASLNEVGSGPDQFGISVAQFHRDNGRRARRWPHSLLATTTHDTKRSEDVRARIDVLSELPETWRGALRRWSRLNQAKKTMVDEQPAPDRNDEYLLYQTLLGAWPNADAGNGSAGARGRWGALLLPGDPSYVEFGDRILAYMQKAAREAKAHTSWVDPDADYERALELFIRRVLDREKNGPFLRDLARIAARVAFFGQFNALSQVLLKMTSPGVPDIYQGQELWDYSLVDPDNRRPVDFVRRRALLTELKARAEQAPDGPLLDLCRDLITGSRDGRIKLFTTWRTLNYRRAHPQLFARGSYTPLEAQGAEADHLVAFARRAGAEKIVVLAPRLVLGLINDIGQPPVGQNVWGASWLALPGETPGTSYYQLFTGETLQLGAREGQAGLALAEALGHFPVALLARETGSPVPEE
jgi:(1->4)-alpha-D-glucan 1-alpha-D-glucosylmutase